MLQRQRKTANYSDGSVGGAAAHSGLSVADLTTTWQQQSRLPDVVCYDMATRGILYDDYSKAMAACTGNDVTTNAMDIPADPHAGARVVNAAS